MADTIKVKPYYVKGCKISNDKIFNGYVIRVGEEDIVRSIARKIGYKSLLCEMSGEGFEYDPVNPYSIPLTELTLGDLMLFLGNFSLL